MKRLYLKTDYRGKVLGRTLAEKIVKLDIEINLIKFYSYWKIKNFCCNRAYKNSDDFEIAYQLFQEYAESVRGTLNFQDFGQEFKFFPCKNAAP